MTLPTVVPTQDDALKIDALLRMVARCQTFQEVAGVALEPDPFVAALEFCWVRGTSSNVRPIALGFVDAVARPVIGYGAPSTFDSRGTVGLLLEIETPAAYRAETGDAYYNYLNTSGAIVREMMDQVGKRDDALIIQSLNTTSIMRSSEAERPVDADADYWQEIFEVVL